MNVKLAVKYLTGHISENEKRHFEQWLNETKTHMAEFEHFSTEWEKTEQNLKDFSPDIQLALRKVKTDINIHVPGPGKKRVFHPWQIAAAAVLLILVSTTFLLSYHFSNRTSGNNYISYITSDSIRHILLPEGTSIWLNTSSELQIPENFSRHNRQAFLQGEAYFVVNKDPSNPFTVSTQNTITQVLGTRFDLNSDSLSDKIYLVEGKISFSSKKQSESAIILLPGYTATYKVASGFIDTYSVKDQNFISWKTGKLDFRNTPLPIVLKELASHYKLSPGIISSDLNNISLTAEFDNQPVNKVIAVIEMTLNIEMNIENDTLYVKNRSSRVQPLSK
jgi:transmembrane sensor